MPTNRLNRFLDAQATSYSNALSEVKKGRKTSHWMWYIFPQLKGLGRSEAANFYGITDKDEAAAYLKHPLLGKHLLEITQALLDVKDKTAKEIFGTPDDLKLKSSMTLFANLNDTSPLFDQVLLKYFDGRPDPLTLKMLSI